MDAPTAASVNVVENFYGVYLLLCENPQYKGYTYIGYTVDPVRRLKRHNAGMEFGGAKRTNNKGPWTMVLIVHGFPNSRAALRFEWAWQHPQLSRHIRHVEKRKSRESMFNYRLKLMSEMLLVAPWCRLPLVVQWIDQKYAKDLHKIVHGPDHVFIQHGEVIAKKISSRTKENRAKTVEKNDSRGRGVLACDICFKNIVEEDLVNCVEKDCQLAAHIVCLAKAFRKDRKILPIRGNCPECHKTILWGDIIRKKIGCQV